MDVDASDYDSDASIEEILRDSENSDFRLIDRESIESSTTNPMDRFANALADARQTGIEESNLVKFIRKYNEILLQSSESDSIDKSIKLITMVHRLHFRIQVIMKISLFLSVTTIRLIIRIQIYDS